MKSSDVMLADCRHVTGHHEFCVFGEGDESPPLLAVRAGIPITEAIAVAESIFEWVDDFEYEILQHGPEVTTRWRRSATLRHPSTNLLGFGRSPPGAWPLL